MPFGVRSGQFKKYIKCKKCTTVFDKIFPLGSVTREERVLL